MPRAAISIPTQPLACGRPEIAPGNDFSLKRKGLVDYRACWRAMQQQAEEIAATHAHELWLVDHPPVYTLGQAGRREHLLNVTESELVQSDRGGQVTWHGPGQIICYTLLHLASLSIGPKQLVQMLEQAVIDTLADLGVDAIHRVGAPGVYAQGAKIASVGLRIRKGVSYHGLALNHSNQLAPFERINPCGYKGLEVTRVADHADMEFAQCRELLLRHLVRNLFASGTADC